MVFAPALVAAANAATTALFGANAVAVGWPIVGAAFRFFGAITEAEEFSAPAASSGPMFAVMGAVAMNALVIALSCYFARPPRPMGRGEINAGGKGSVARRRHAAPQSRRRTPSRGGGAGATGTSGQDQARGGDPNPHLGRRVLKRRGLKNRRNDCFVNTAIQIVRGMPVVHAKLLEFPDTPTPPTGKRVTWAVSRLCKALQRDGRMDAVNPEEFLRCFFSELGRAHMFLEGCQGDMALAFGALMERMHTETEEDDGSSIVQSARGWMRTTSTCPLCGISRDQPLEPFFVVQLTVPGECPPPNGWSVRKLIEQAFAPTTTTKPCETCEKSMISRTMEGSEKSLEEVKSELRFEADQCVVISPEMVMVPAELSFNLKRVEVDTRTKTYKRSDVRVDITPRLHLNDLFPGHATTETADLTAVGCHYGNSLDSGHWAASLRTGDQETLVDFSDTWVSDGDPNERASNATFFVYAAS